MSRKDYIVMFIDIEAVTTIEIVSLCIWNEMHKNVWMVEFYVPKLENWSLPFGTCFIFRVIHLFENLTHMIRFMNYYWIKQINWLNMDYGLL
jgi:hypothetical protein